MGILNQIKSLFCSEKPFEFTFGGLHCQELETRLLLSSTAEITDASGFQENLFEASSLNNEITIDFERTKATESGEIQLGNGFLVVSMRNSKREITQRFEVSSFRRAFGLEFDLIVFGKNGDDRITNNSNYKVKIVGGNGNDHLISTQGGDFLAGGRGNDSLVGNAGGDRIFGGPGRDYINGGNGKDFLNGRGGKDIIFGDNGNDVIRGGGGGDQLTGGTGNDWINGDGGADAIRGGLGADTIFGGEGIDKINGGGSFDTLIDFSPINYLVQAYRDIAESIGNGQIDDDISGNFQFIKSIVLPSTSDIDQVDRKIEFNTQSELDEELTSVELTSSQIRKTKTLVDFSKESVVYFGETQVTSGYQVDFKANQDSIELFYKAPVFALQVLSFERSLFVIPKDLDWT